MSEPVDIRDEEGKVTGTVMTRQEAHQAEARHGVAQVWLYSSKGEILLQRRAAHLNAFPEKWDVSVSGHLTAGDEPLQTAARELAEELGVTASTADFTSAGMILDDFELTYGKNHRGCDYVFLLKRDVEIEDLKLQAAEVLDVRWITPDDLEHDLADPAASKDYAARNPEIYRKVIDAVRHA